MRAYRTLVTAALAVAMAAGLAGCSNNSSSAAVFRSQSAARIDQPQACLLHQNAAPTAAYQGGSSENPDDELGFLAYYTANGNKPFCDNKSATAMDKTWAALYVSLTNAPANVSAITG